MTFKQIFKYKYLKAFGGLIIILFFALASCREEPTQPPAGITEVKNTVILSSPWQEMHRYAIKWTRSLVDTNKRLTYILKRKDAEGLETGNTYYLTGKDTTIIEGSETSPIPEGALFNYKMEVYNDAGELLDTSKSIITGTLNTTGANFMWEIDTLGIPGDYLYAVWGTDTNNVWAVGRVNFNEGKTAIIKWNGTEWSYHSWPLASIYSIYGFSENDIWVVGESSNRSFIGHYKDGEWTEYRSDYFYSRGDTVYALWGVWGASPDDVWAVGYNGTIVHWNGENWDKVESGTKANMTGIWGVSATEIYAVSPFIIIDNVIHFEGNTFLYDGESWSNIQSEVGESSGPLRQTQFYPNGCGVAVGRNVYIKDNTGWHLQVEVPRIGNQWGRVGGTNINDVMILGIDGSVTSRIMHYNGEHWETISINGSTTIPMIIGGVQLFKKKVFIVGKNNNHIIIYRGERK